jgi:hypothetical protein
MPPLNEESIGLEVLIVPRGPKVWAMPTDP